MATRYRSSPSWPAPTPMVPCTSAVVATARMWPVSTASCPSAILTRMWAVSTARPSTTDAPTSADSSAFIVAGVVPRPRAVATAVIDVAGAWGETACASKRCADAVKSYPMVCDARSRWPSTVRALESAGPVPPSCEWTVRSRRSPLTRTAPDDQPASRAAGANLVIRPRSTVSKVAERLTRRARSRSVTGAMGGGRLI